jgi:hypothetical protein
VLIDKIFNCKNTKIPYLGGGLQPINPDPEQKIIGIVFQL